MGNLFSTLDLDTLLGTVCLLLLKPVALSSFGLVVWTRWESLSQPNVTKFYELLVTLLKSITSKTD